VEAWPLELSFQCSLMPDALSVSEAVFAAGAAKASTWERLVVRFPQLRAVIDAANAAPTLGNRGQSLLHVWSGLEALFPSVSAEVSFRLALYIAQLTVSGVDRLSCYESVRTAYGTRSKIAHGAKGSVSAEEWNQAWAILMNCLNALHRREGLPAERELLGELLT
jgi:hypothetical protein